MLMCPKSMIPLMFFYYFNYFLPRFIQLFQIGHFIDEDFHEKKSLEAWEFVVGSK